MTWRPLRLAATAGVIALVLPTLCALSGCGSGNGQLSVTLTADSAQYTAGTTARLDVRVTNNGPGDAPGVSVHVDMPSDFRYKAAAINGGQARTQPVDARVGTNNPAWGVWDLAAPTQQITSFVEIAFTVDVEAAPSSYALLAHASGDNTSGDVLSKQLLVAVQPSPHLAVTASVSANALKAGDRTTYSITVTNSGSAIGADVGVLITLPPVLTFQQSLMPFRGNASRDRPVDPVRGSVVVFYGGFNIPNATNSGAGFVTIAFVAQVVPRPAGGTFPISVQVTDLNSDVVLLSNAATITVQSATGSSPSASASPSM